MYTLPLKTRIKLRRPSRQLLRMLAPMFPGGIAAVPAASRERISVELTDWVNRDADRNEENRRFYGWYSFASGAHASAGGPNRVPFEVEPAYALLMRRGADLVIYMNAFSVEPDAMVAMDIARDALLEGREVEALRILREALPHGYPLFIALVQKERNLLALT